MAEIPIVLILVGLAAYTVLGGADFGAGLWELTARGERGSALRDHTHRSMAPVWEANHVWLIFVLVMAWTCYPEAFGSIASTLTIPLFVAGVGIILRGAAYALRAGTTTPREEGAISLLFALSSILTPFALGLVVGGIASGRVPVGNAQGDEITSWWNGTSLLIGVLAVATAAYLAAVYLAADARRIGSDDVAEAFRTRALVAGLVAGALAAAGPFILSSDAPDIYDGLTSGAGLVALLASGVAGVAALALVVTRRYGAARLVAAAAVAAIVAGWGLAQRPEILPGLTIDEAAASDTTITAVLIGFAVGLLILAPSLAYLFRLLLTGRFDPATAPQPGPAPADAAAAAADPTAHSSLRTTLITGAVTALGAGITFVSNGPLRSIGVALMLGGAFACFLAVASLDEADPPAVPFPTPER
ncbi:MAG TPA: cytochrome d ubiquinol oxidase subunit II [Thermoleophilaceae bacterium]|nr:cytochrome d ubiquinol oxidase subunit II [Thermoleophilaceae bacterium]